MGENSKIAWTDHTWNPWQGCHKVSDGCKNCYMYRDKKRYGQDASIVVRSALATFNKPLTWKEPAKVFVCSWSDFFIKEADKWRMDAYKIMEKTPHLTYLLLTKRPDRMINILSDNQWIGVTVENAKNKWRIDRLRYKIAPVKFLSIEPLIGDIGNLNLNGIDWVIVGAESGPNRRPCNLEWIWDIIRQCDDMEIPVFIKQLDFGNKLSTNPKEWPEDLRRQEFPK